MSRNAREYRVWAAITGVMALALAAAALHSAWQRSPDGVGGWLSVVILMAVAIGVGGWHLRGAMTGNISESLRASLDDEPDIVRPGQLRVRSPLRVLAGILGAALLGLGGYVGCVAPQNAAAQSTSRLELIAGAWLLFAFSYAFLRVAMTGSGQFLAPVLGLRVYGSERD